MPLYGPSILGNTILTGTATLDFGVAGAGYIDTSHTNIDLGTGSRTFVVSSGKSFAPGNILKLQEEKGCYVIGTVTSYSGTHLVLNVTNYHSVEKIYDEGVLDTSSSSITLGTGIQTFVVSANMDFEYGEQLYIVNPATDNYMTGVVISYSGTSLVVSILESVGTGTYADWNIGHHLHWNIELLSVGSYEATATVTGQTGIDTNSYIGAYLQGNVTTDHTADEHLLAAAYMHISCSNITPNDGFVIHAVSQVRLIGQFTVNYFWS